MIFYKLLLKFIKTALSASLPQTPKKSFSLKELGVLTDFFSLNSATETTCIYSSLGDVVFVSSNVRLTGAIHPLHIIMSI